MTMVISSAVPRGLLFVGGIATRASAVYRGMATGVQLPTHRRITPLANPTGATPRHRYHRRMVLSEAIPIKSRANDGSQGSTHPTEQLA